MTPDALHKRAERQRRREAGYKRVECWLSSDAMHALGRIQRESGGQTSDIIEVAVLHFADEYEGADQ